MPPGVAPPVVFVDIDGVLIPLRARPAGPRPSLRDGAGAGSGNPLLERLDPDDGPRLRALAADLVWASTWMAEANEVVAPRLGLAALPFVDWPDDEEQTPRGVHWKTAPLMRWAAGRPFVWLDDEITSADRLWAEAHYPRAALLHRVDPYVGLSDADTTAVSQWLSKHGETA